MEDAGYRIQDTGFIGSGMVWYAVVRVCVYLGKIGRLKNHDSGFRIKESRLNKQSKIQDSKGFITYNLGFSIQASNGHECEKSRYIVYVYNKFVKKLYITVFRWIR